MTDELSNNEEIVVNELMPATPREIADALGVTESYVWDIAYNLRQKGFDVSQNGQGEYFVPELHTDFDSPNTSEVVRMTSESKAAITRKAKQYLAETRRMLQDELETTEPLSIDGGVPAEEGHQDFIAHYTDLHFGQVVKNQHGSVVFDSKIAEQRFRGMVNQGLERANLRRQVGTEFDAGHVLLGGDIVTNENIYDGQAHEIDETLRQQIQRASRAITWAIKRFADEFPFVQVVCVPGNHGELRSGNASSHANADTILYDSVELAIRESDLDNVYFTRSDAVHYVNFQIRNWNAHMRHGHDSSLEHIGTSAGKQRWGQWLLDHEFDVAFRGHYHMYKEEPISGVPVHMGGSITEQSGFEESMALSSRPVGAVHGATDVAPTHWTEKIYFG